MKRRLIYVLTILVIVLSSWLLLNNRESKGALEKEGKEVAKVNANDSSTTAVKVTVNNGQIPVQYLTPAYKVTVQGDILYASKKNETDAVEPLKLDLYEPSGDDNKKRPVFIFIHGGVIQEAISTMQRTFLRDWQSEDMLYCPLIIG